MGEIIPMNGWRKRASNTAVDATESETVRISVKRSTLLCVLRMLGMGAFDLSRVERLVLEVRGEDS